MCRVFAFARICVLLPATCLQSAYGERRATASRSDALDAIAALRGERKDFVVLAEGRNANAVVSDGNGTEDETVFLARPPGKPRGTPMSTDTLPRGLRAEQHNHGGKPAKHPSLRVEHNHGGKPARRPSLRVESAGTDASRPPPRPPKVHRPKAYQPVVIDEPPDPSEVELSTKKGKWARLTGPSRRASHAAPGQSSPVPFLKVKGGQEAAYGKLFHSLRMGSTIAAKCYARPFGTPPASPGLPTATLASVRLSPEAVRNADVELRARAPRYCMAIVKDGKMVYTSGAWNRANYAFSLTKTLFALLIGMASRKSSVHASLDIHQFTTFYGVPSPVKYNVTSAMIMSQAIAGQSPGELFEYDTFGTRWLNCLIRVVQAATGRSIKNYFDEMKAVLQFKIEYNGEDAAHSAIGSCLDFAKMGQLILNKGVWEGRKVVSRSFIESMVTPHVFGSQPANPCYGYMTWLLGPMKRQCPLTDKGPADFPAAPDGDAAWVAAATLGQIVIGIPSSRMVVVSMGTEHLQEIVSESFATKGKGEEHIGGVTALQSLANALQSNGLR